MYTNYKLKLDKTFQAEVREDELIISAETKPIENESLEKLESFCDSLDLDKRVRQSIFDDTLEMVHDHALIQAIKSRIK